MSRVLCCLSDSGKRRVESEASADWRLVFGAVNAVAALILILTYFVCLAAISAA